MLRTNVRFIKSMIIEGKSIINKEFNQNNNIKIITDNIDRKLDIVEHLKEINIKRERMKQLREKREKEWTEWGDNT